MKNFIFLLFLVFITFTTNAQTQCMSFFTITPGLVPETSTSPPLAIFYWDISNAVYNTNTTTSIQIIKSISCTWTENGPIQNYPINNFFSSPTGSKTISIDGIGSRCFKWRFVNQGNTSAGARCFTATSWVNYNAVNYY